MSTVLWIGRYSSHCGDCGRHADPIEATHASSDEGEAGCGARFTHVGADYMLPGRREDHEVRALRPDLPYVGPRPAPTLAQAA